MTGIYKHVWSILIRRCWPLYLIVIFILCLGIAVGSLTVNGLGGLQVSELQDFLEQFFTQIGQIKINNISLIKMSLLNNTLLIVFIYFLGLTVIGIPIMLALIFARGFTLGFTVGFLFKERAFRGIVLALAAVVPANLFYLPALIIGGATALSFTLLLIKRNFDPNLKLRSGFLYYNVLMLAVVIISLGAGLIDAYITPFLTRVAVRLIS